MTAKSLYFRADKISDHLSTLKADILQSFIFGELQNRECK